MKSMNSFYVIITPYKRAFDEFCRSNELAPSKQIWVGNDDDIYKTFGLKLSEKQIILLDEWYKIQDAQKVYERVREDSINYPHRKELNENR